jgi:hypothetical protein
MSRKTPIKTRRLKNADRVEQFFFMYFEGHQMADWLRLEFEVDLFFLRYSPLEAAHKSFPSIALNENSSTLFAQKRQKLLGKYF